MAKKTEKSTELATTKSLLPAIVRPEKSDDVFAPSDNMVGVDAVIPVIEVVHAAQVFKFGEGETAKEFTGIVLHHQAGRSFWKNADVTGTPPDCSSDNGLFPNMGTPPFKPAAGSKAACANCPMNDWASDPKGGRGKACKQKHSIFVLVCDEAYQSAIPYLLRLPPTSLKAIGAYMTSLTGRRIPVQTVITRFSLVTKEGQGQKYSQLVLSCGKERLSREDQIALRDMINQFGSRFKQAAAEETAKPEAAEGTTTTEDPDNFA